MLSFNILPSQLQLSISNTAFVKYPNPTNAGIVSGADINIYVYKPIIIFYLCFNLIFIIICIDIYLLYKYLFYKKSLRCIQSI